MSILRGAALLLAPLALVGMAGCASEPHEDLTLHSAGHDASFTERFARAYLSREKEGDVDIVLVDRGTEQQLDASGRGSAETAPPPVRQVMHLRVLWNPMRDQKGDHSVASNASLHWYVMGNTPGTRADVLEYAGTAFVVMDDSEPAELSIRNASIHPVACRGDLQDPVGASTLTGTVHATTDRRRVRAALDSVRTAVSAALARPESASSMAR